MLLDFTYAKRFYLEKRISVCTPDGSAGAEYQGRPQSSLARARSCQRSIDRHRICARAEPRTEHWFIYGSLGLVLFRRRFPKADGGRRAYRGDFPPSGGGSVHDPPRAGILTLPRSEIISKPEGLHAPHLPQLAPCVSSVYGNGVSSLNLPRFVFRLSLLAVLLAVLCQAIPTAPVSLWRDRGSAFSATTLEVAILVEQDVTEKSLTPSEPLIPTSRSAWRGSASAVTVPARLTYHRHTPPPTDALWLFTAPTRAPPRLT